MLWALPPCWAQVLSTGLAAGVRLSKHPVAGAEAQAAHLQLRLRGGHGLPLWLPQWWRTGETWDQPMLAPTDSVLTFCPWVKHWLHA